VKTRLYLPFRAGRKSINVWDSDSSVRGHMENIVDAIDAIIYI